MYVIKADGRRERFQPQKIIRTCLRADASKEAAEEIAEEIENSVRDGATTHEIYGMILKGLRKRRNGSSFVFTIRESISKLDSLSFELYIKKILEMHGYKCRWDVILHGKCVEHQIDIIAEKEKTFLVECKHHINYHRFCGLGNILQIQARLEDLIDGFGEKKNSYDFDYAWMITNTKFSDHAKIYAGAKNIRLTGWRYKEAYALEDLVETKRIFPVTILRCSEDTQRYLLGKEVIILQDLINADSRKLKAIDKYKLEGLIRQARQLIS